MNDTPSQTKVLIDLHQVAANLQALLRKGLPLTEAEQLFVENRLMMMQIEYQQWAKRQSKENRERSQNAGTSTVPDHLREVNK